MIEYTLWNGDGDFSDDLLNLIDLEQPLMFDVETIDLYGRIRLAQFYQSGWANVVIVEYPEIYQLLEVLNKCWIVAHAATYEVSTIQAALQHQPWQPVRFDDTYYLSRLHFYDKPLPSLRKAFTLNLCVKYATGTDPYLDFLPLTKSDLQQSDWSAPSLSKEQKLYAAYDVYYMHKVWDVVKAARSEESYKLDKITIKNNLRFQCNGLPVILDSLNALLDSNFRRLDEIALPVNCNSHLKVRDYIGCAESDGYALDLLSIKGDKKAAAVRECRKLTTQNSFLLKYKDVAHGMFGTGIIRGRFAPAARSGRSTCNKLNLQNVPNLLKVCFGLTLESNLVLVYSDFSQLELRCITAITGDPSMLDIYIRGGDIHTFTASRLFHTSEPTKQQRHVAKTCNFGLLYGGSAAVLIKQLVENSNILLTQSEAESIHARWLNLWPGIKNWQKKGKHDHNLKRAWQTPLGRRYFGNLVTDQLNMMVQGMGAEVARLANFYIDQSLEAQGIEGWGKWQRNFIHDSYIFIVPNDPVIYKQLSVTIADAMQKAWQYMSKDCLITDLPMPVSVSTGMNWGTIETDSIYTYEQP